LTLSAASDGSPAWTAGRCSKGLGSRPGCAAAAGMAGNLKGRQDAECEGSFVHARTEAWWIARDGETVARGLAARAGFALVRLEAAVVASQGLGSERAGRDERSNFGGLASRMAPGETGEREVVDKGGSDCVRAVGHLSRGGLGETERIEVGLGRTEAGSAWIAVVPCKRECRAGLPEAWCWP